MDEEFWKPHSNLKQQFVERLQEMGGNDLAIACVDSFFALDGAKSWKPEKVLLGEVAHVIDVGLVLLIVGQSNLPNNYKQKINESVVVGTKVPPDLWSELLVATFLKYYGVTVQFVPRGPSKTADLDYNWKGQAFDVEVTRGKMKALHVTAQERLNDFVAALVPGDVDWHIMCFVSDGSDEKILAETFEAAVKLHPGERSEVQGLWSVVAVPLADRDTIAGGQAVELLAPTWWPKKESAFFTTATILNGKGNPVVALRSLVPHAPYMNSIRRKAEHGQHTVGRPYIIALDASELPGAIERLSPDIERKFSIWTHVSGVLILIPFFYTNSTIKKFKFRLLTNPYADSKMPSDLLDLCNASQNEVKFEICK